MTGSRAPHNVSALTQPFWEAASRRELVRPVCDECGNNFFTPQVACPACHSERWRYRTSSGRGTVHSFTVVHRAPTGDFDPPYVVADVDVEEGWNLMTNIVGCAAGGVRIGQRVAVAFQDVGDDAVLPVFAPDPEAIGGSA